VRAEYLYSRLAFICGSEASLLCFDLLPGLFLVRFCAWSLSGLNKHAPLGLQAGGRGRGGGVEFFHHCKNGPKGHW